MILSRLQNYMHTVPLRWGLCVPVCLGLGIAAYFALPAMPTTAPVVGAILLAAAAGAVAGRVEALRELSGAIALILLGFVLAHCQTTFSGTAMIRYDLGVRDVTGRITDIEPQDGYVRLYFSDLSVDRLAPESTPHRLRLSYRLAAPPPAIGTRVTCRAALKPIAPPVLPDGYDFRQHYYFERIGATGFIVAPCIVMDPPPPYGYGVASARNAMQEIIRTQLQGDESAITTALLTGVQEGISDNTMTAMRVSGLVHILSPSGLHIGLAAGIVFFALRALLALFPFIALRYPIKKWAAGAALLSAWAYTLFVGAPVPAVRSALMVTLALVAVMLDRQALTLRTIALAATAVLLVYPASMLSPSFHMSFAAVTAIIAVMEATEAWRTRLMADRTIILRALLYVGGSVAVALVATLATLPFTYYHFQQVNLYGVIANMLADPLAAFWLMPLAVVVFLTAPLGLADWPLAVLGQGVAVLMAIARGTAALPGADWIVPAMPYGALVCMVAGMLWLLVWRGRMRWIGIGILFLSLPLIALHERPRALIDGQGRFAVFAAGDGRYALMTTAPVRGDNFILGQWQKYLGLREWATPARCDSAGCFDGTIDYLRDANALVEVCNSQKSYILLTADSPRRCPALVDAYALRHNGAHSIDADGTVHSTGDAVGQWPWRSWEEKD